MIQKSNKKLSSKKTNNKYIFLAGTIDTNASNWRKQVIDKLNNSYHFFDPTNYNHSNLNKEEMEKHINWELDALMMADIIILNLLKDSKSPISLIELGLYVKTKKMMVVCPNAYYKSRYVLTLCEKYNTPVYNHLDDLIQSLK